VGAAAAQCRQQAGPSPVKPRVRAQVRGPRRGPQAAGGGWRQVWCGGSGAAQVQACVAGAKARVPQVAFSPAAAAVQCPAAGGVVRRQAGTAW